MPWQKRGTYIMNAPATTRFYQGSNAQRQISFDRTWELLHINSYTQLDIRAVLALGLTERCVAVGRGMVSAFQCHSLSSSDRQT